MSTFDDSIIWPYTSTHGLHPLGILSSTYWKFCGEKNKENEQIQRETRGGRYLKGRNDEIHEFFTRWKDPLILAWESIQKNPSFTKSST